MDVSIIIVNYNTKVITNTCIESIFRNTADLSFEIIVIDNASTDGSAEFFKQNDRINLICSKENLGFGRANNLGLALAKGEYILFLNSDTILLNNAVKCFLDFMKSNESSLNIGVLGSFLQNSDGYFSLSFGTFPTPWTEIAYLLEKISNTLTTRRNNVQRPNEGKSYLEVDFVSGADMFIPTKIMRKIGGFDPKFFLYYEETDLQKRIANAGYRRIVIRTPQIVHLEGGSDFEQKKFSFFMLMQSNLSLLIYMRKHFDGMKYFLFRTTMLIIRSTILFDYRFNWKQKWHFYKQFMFGYHL